MSRGTPEGAAYNDLRNKARDENRPFDELLAFHVLDGFLARLPVSAERDRLVLKGRAATNQERPRLLFKVMR